MAMLGGKNMEDASSATNIDTLTMPTPEAHRLNESVLIPYLCEHVKGFHGEAEIRKFRGGQSNPTYLILSGGRHYVLRKKPPGHLLPSAHAVERECRVMTALRYTGVPVPRIYGLCEDSSIIGTPFFIMEYVAGRVFWDPALPGLTPQERAALYNEMNRVIALLHQVNYKAVGLGGYGKPGNYFARQIDRWTRQYRAAETERVEAMENLIRWLPDHIPSGDETTLVHGDFRLDNLIFHPAEARILAILDWELSTLGNPLADFSYSMMAWRLAPEEFRGMRGADLATLGIPDENCYREDYCRRTGRSGIEHWEFYLAYNMFRMAGILQGVFKRMLDGNAAAPDASDAGRRARPMAEAGWRIVEGMKQN
jgi:aminoglycoside phosphotransferase (APT) family kinase protein